MRLPQFDWLTLFGAVCLGGYNFPTSSPCPSTTDQGRDNYLLCAVRCSSLTVKPAFLALHLLGATSITEALVTIPGDSDHYATCLTPSLDHHRTGTRKGTLGTHRFFLLTLYSIQTRGAASVPGTMRLPLPISRNACSQAFATGQWLIRRSSGMHGLDQ